MLLWPLGPLLTACKARAAETRRRVLSRTLKGLKQVGAACHGVPRRHARGLVYDYIHVCMYILFECNVTLSCASFEIETERAIDTCIP